MDVKVIVGCVVLISLIVVLVVSAWKFWRGEWLRLIAGGWTFAPDEEPGSPYYHRRAKRIALDNLVLAVALAGWLGLLIADQLGNSLASGQTWPFAVLILWSIGSAIYVLGGSRRDSKVISAAATGTGPELSEEYEFGTRQVVFLVVIMVAVVAFEIALNFLDRGF